MDFVREWCEGDNWFRPVRATDGYKLAPAGVEEHQCALVCVLVGAGMAAVGISAVISAIGAVGVVMEERGGGGGGGGGGGPPGGGGGDLPWWGRGRLGMSMSMMGVRFVVLRMISEDLRGY
jgi:hypothetical protein